jgi:hypothetical protein
MKNNIFLIILLLAGIFSSCTEDYLIQESPDKLNTGNFWRNKSDVEGAMAAVYSQLESSNDYWSGYQEGRQVMKQYRSDLIEYGADANNYASWTDIYNFTYTYGNPNIFWIWKPNYQGLFYANQIISKVPNISGEELTEDEKKAYIAEARFLRAYYHFDLLLNFEQIIIRDEPTAEKNLEKALSTRSEAFDHILDDLIFASENLPEYRDAENTGRATKFTALAYLGKVYLHRAGEVETSTYFEEANKAFAPIVASKQFDLVDDYLSMFDGTASNTEESLFEFQTSPNEDNGAYYKFVLYYFYGANAFGGWEEIIGTQRMVDAMKTEGTIANDGNYDMRLYWNCFFNDPYFNDAAEPRLYGTTWDDKFDATNNSVYLRKYLPEDESIFNTWGYAQNVPLMRYADVLLMYAESLNEEGRTNEAIPLINEVRERANMPKLTITDQDAVREQIKHERVMEFTLEGSRFFDLRRWGDLENAMKAAGRSNFDINKHSFLPIPELEVISNGEIK